VNLKRPLFGPHHPRGPSKGRDVKDFVKRTLYRLPAALPVGADFFPKPPGGFDDIYNEKTVDAVRVFQQYTEIEPATGNFGQATLDEMWPYADAYSKWVYRLYSPPHPSPVVPYLGPIVAGDSALSAIRLTHPTTGIPGYPAVDAGWVVGRDVLAPEDITVTKASSANVGDAFYARGKSTIEYWVGHIVVAPWVGRTFSPGEKVGDIAPHPNGAHVHFGVNATPLIGKSLICGYGSDVPTVGQQLRDALA